jgi:hypothetical protein
VLALIKTGLLTSTQISKILTTAIEKWEADARRNFVYRNLTEAIFPSESYLRDQLFASLTSQQKLYFSLLLHDITSSLDKRETGKLLQSILSMPVDHADLSETIPLVISLIKSRSEGDEFNGLATSICDVFEWYQ